MGSTNLNISSDSLTNFILGKGQLIDVVPIDDVVRVIDADINKDIKLMIPQFTGFIRQLLRKKVPVRTGKLLDSLLNTLNVKKVGNMLVVGANPPTGYPVIIVNPAHFGNKVGYAYGKFEPSTTITNRALVRETPKGAYYLLNDPDAIGDYYEILGAWVLPAVEYIMGKTLGIYDVEIKLDISVLKAMGTLRKIVEDTMPAVGAAHDVFDFMVEAKADGVEIGDYRTLMSDPTNLKAAVYKQMAMRTGGNPITGEHLKFTSEELMEWINSRLPK